MLRQKKTEGHVYISRDSYGVDDIKSIKILNKDASNPLCVSRLIKYKVPTIRD